MTTDRPAILPGGTLRMPGAAHPYPGRHLGRVVAQQLAGELRNDDFAEDVAAQVIAALSQHPDLLRGLADDAQPPRVWWPGATDVPDGTWVLTRTGHVDRVVADVDDPDAMPVAGPVVEVRLPDYDTAVERDTARDGGHR